MDKWTITTIINNPNKKGDYGNHDFVEFDNFSEVTEELKRLEEQGQEMDYVTIFPPRSGFTVDEVNKLFK